MSFDNEDSGLNDSLAQQFGSVTWQSEDATVRPQWRHPALALLFASLCILTVAGNCLVVVAVCTKKYLRNPTGYLIVSLAFADLIVGLVVMPLNSLFEMTRQVWILGLTMCDLFHALDILASTSSIWNLCVISLDRYLAGQDPIGYRDKVSNVRITESCRSLMLERHREDRRNCTANSPLLRPESETGFTSFNTFGVFRHSTRSRLPGSTRPSIDRTASMVTVFPSEYGRESANSNLSSSLQPVPPSRRRLGVREKSRQMMKYVHEQRAARTLSIVVGAFILCWMPFFIFSPIMALCHSCIGNQEAVFSIITWAGHLNSMLNPLIYSRFSRDFRRAFKQILTCQRERPTKKAIKTPLSLVFAQLVSITQFWDQNHPGSLSTIVD
ncbi:hypothetical protein QR680_001941 [Steinernema hermaphroditum]|uniref:G-protein coupled receptors family 1 profile domain-containing protein n=1 Tax=Steinernema hermaphroditum TaxID=289476 RepID=A0AA39LH62_9BILA|nr:hypothetical protein QR680_001941 [Steinernema hermaphroditum]